MTDVLFCSRSRRKGGVACVIYMGWAGKDNDFPFSLLMVVLISIYDQTLGRLLLFNFSQILFYMFMFPVSFGCFISYPGSQYQSCHTTKGH